MSDLWMHSFWQFSPELCVLVGALAVLVFDLISENHQTSARVAGLAAALSVATAGWICQVGPYSPEALHPYLATVLVVDRMALFLKALIGLLTLLTVMLAYRSFAEERRHYGEYYTLLMFIALGEMLAVSSNEFLTFFIAFELLSLPLYVLAAFRRYQARSAEAGLKYFLTGALSSALLLYGISFIYGSLGTTVFSDFGRRLLEVPGPPHALLVGAVLVLVGLSFKIAAAPFHNWAPDVYEGAPTAVVAYLSNAPKAAMAGVLLRLFGLQLAVSGREFHLSIDWSLLSCILAMLSMLLGNLSALSQTSVKRLLAYSGISNIGYLLIGLAACYGPEGPRSFAFSATLYYVAAYCLANLGAWGAVLLASQEKDNLQVTELNGLARRSPALALVLLICLMSLAGVPPLAGFVGKFFLFRAAYEAKLRFLVVFGIVNSVISLYYYFKVLRAAYFFEPPSGSAPISLGPSQVLALTTCTLAAALCGLWPALARWAIFVSPGA